MKKTLTFLSLIAASSTPFVANSCVDFDNIHANNVFIKNENQANMLYQNQTLKPSDSYINNEIVRTIFAPLISYSYQGKVHEDKINNNFDSITKKILNFYLADSIVIYLPDNNGDLTQFSFIDSDYSLNLTKPDKGSGYSKPILMVSSPNQTSINNPDFWNKLKQANKVEFNLKDNLFYVDKQANQTKINFKANDIADNLLNNQAYLKKIKNLYNVTFMMQNNKLIFSIANAEKEAKLDLFVQNEVMNNFIFQPQPQGQKDLFLGTYVVSENEISKLILLKNDHSANESFNNASDSLAKIIFNYNPVPLDEETFRIQSLRAYRQNLISMLNYSTLNSKQQENVLKYSDIYGYNEVVSFNSKDAIFKWTYNHDIKANKSNNAFNNDFANFINSLSKKELFYFEKALAMLLNPYTIAKLSDSNYYWNVAPLASVQLQGIDQENNNFDSLSEAYYLSTLTSFDNLQSNYFIEKEVYYEKENILDLNKQLKSANFKALKEIIASIISKFKQVHPNANISFIIPVLDTFSEKEKLLLERYKNLLNDNFDLNVQIEEYDSNKTYFFRKTHISYLNNSLESFFKVLWDDFHSVQSFSYFLDLANDEAIQKFINLKTLDEFLNYLNTKTTYEQIKIINTFNNYFNIPVILNNALSEKTFEKILIQNYLELPSFEDGIINYADVRITY
ncbi:hypothetical protein VO56_00200 [Mycoplasmopsis gallinacea]|uniref:Lipoprotein n=1 Tax=Mycoplasmopsis gallinacea TaxID=29556 RepID=A0A0D5ZIT6_9BACT|nr:hypothetical protein VO56_00200 [Mycoplasmopsis gallinacea]